MGSYHYFHTSTLPHLRQIVWCRLPHFSDLVPGATVRPALVLGIRHHPIKKRGAVQVAYGTNILQTVRRERVDLIIQNASRLAALGLPQAVRFDLGATNWLPWAEEFFQPPAHSIHIVAGSLTDTEIQRLRRALHRRGIIRDL